MKKAITYLLIALVLMTTVLFLKAYLHRRNRGLLMEETKKVIAKVYTEALAKNKSGQQLEMRFYRSIHRAPDATEGWYSFESLQAYRVNPDNTCSPVGELIHMPKDIVFFSSGATTGEYFDLNKGLATMRIDQPDFSEGIVLYDFTTLKQTPEVERTMLISHGKVFLHIDPSDHADLISVEVPGYYSQPSLPVRQP